MPLILAATPIGDPRDAAPRLTEVLASAEVVAAEEAEFTENLKVKESLLVDAVHARTEAPDADTGSLRGDLEAEAPPDAVLGVERSVTGRRWVWRGGDEIRLTATEFELLRYLMRNPRRVLSKAQILDRVWHYDFGGQANVVELYISYLRKKIDAGRDPMIHTMRGAGYVLKPAR